MLRSRIELRSVQLHLLKGPKYRTLYWLSFIDHCKRKWEFYNSTLVSVCDIPAIIGNNPVDVDVEMGPFVYGGSSTSQG